MSDIRLPLFTSLFFRSRIHRPRSSLRSLRPSPALSPQRLAQPSYSPNRRLSLSLPRVPPVSTQIGCVVSRLHLAPSICAVNFLFGVLFQLHFPLTNAPGFPVSAVATFDSLLWPVATASRRPLTVCFYCPTFFCVFSFACTVFPQATDGSVGPLPRLRLVALPVFFRRFKCAALCGTTACLSYPH